jgi:hypothetical protein
MMSVWKLAFGLKGALSRWNFIPVNEVNSIPMSKANSLPVDEVDYLPFPKGE